ncbi:uracil-DNA glycosylase family protein, partial [Peptostreptococcus stomatis]
MSLKGIIKQIELDKRNTEYTNKNIPPILQVDKEARILIVGQAPGKKVEESLIPFNDKSGETLISWMGIDKDTFYSKEIA